MGYPRGTAPSLKMDDLIAMIADEADTTDRLAKRVLTAYGAVVYDSMIRGERVRLPGVGRFYPLPVKPRMRYNIYANTKFLCAATIQIKFTTDPIIRHELAKVVARNRKVKKKPILAVSESEAGNSESTKVSERS